MTSIEHDCLLAVAFMAVGWLLDANVQGGKALPLTDGGAGENVQYGEASVNGGLCVVFGLFTFSWHLKPSKDRLRIWQKRFASSASTQGSGVPVGASSRRWATACVSSHPAQSRRTATWISPRAFANCMT